jgi:serine/threonine protein kinase
LPSRNEEAMKSLNLLMKLNHNNILNVIDVIVPENKNSVYFILPYYQNGNLFNIIKEQDQKSLKLESHLKLVAKWSAQLISALLYLHNEQKVVHGNITPKNV